MCLLHLFSPIKAISGFLGVPSFYWGFLYFTIMLMLIWNNLADVIYRSTCVFLHSILSISFKSIEVVGLDNIPKEGPVIFTGACSVRERESLALCLFFLAMYECVCNDNRVGYIAALFALNRKPHQSVRGCSGGHDDESSQGKLSYRALACHCSLSM